MVCLLSKEWEASKWCLFEYHYADTLGKRVFCARLEEDAGAETAAWQRCDLFGDGPTTVIDIGAGDLVEFSTEGLIRLREGIRGAGIGADSFEWPIDDPDRAPYRGWQPFEPVDAGIFFGRDAQIVRAMDAMRGIRATRLKQWFVVLGPSGSGKSSFLRAGLMPRLQRADTEFVVLPIVRPEHDVLTGPSGLARAIHAARVEKGLVDPPLFDIESACAKDKEPKHIRALLNELQAVAQAHLLDTAVDSPPPTIVLPLDQAEELLTPGAEPQCSRFLELIRDLVVPAEGDHLDLVVAATIRSDRFEGLQTRAELAATEIEIFGELKPMPREQFKEVITFPAERVTADGRPLQLSADLVEQLLADCKEGSDTLPLLSLSLFRLYERYSSVEELDLTHYRRLGGLRRVVATVIGDILDHEPTERLRQLDLLRSAFIPWLATVNPDNDQPMRRVARWQEIPEASRPLIDAFVAHRLLIKDRRDGDDVVEVALESLLRLWDDLAGWLEEHWDDLKAVDALERAAADWEYNGRQTEWVLTGNRLAAAETLANSPAFHDRLAVVSEYLLAGRQAEEERIAQQLREETSLRLLTDAREMLTGGRSGGDARAFQMILAAMALDNEADDGVLHSAVIKRRTTLKIFETEHFSPAFGLNPQGWMLATAGYRDQSVRLWDVDTGHLLTGPLDHRDRVSDIAFSTDGRSVATVGNDYKVRLWDAYSGRLLAVLGGHTGYVFTLAFSPDGSRLATGGLDNEGRLWDAETGELIELLAGHTGGIWDLAFSRDNTRLVTASDDHTVRVWDGHSGRPAGPVLTGHTTRVHRVAIRPDGQRVASASVWPESAVRLWDFHTRQPLGGPLTGHTGTVSALAFSPRGNLLAAGSSDNTARLWDSDTGAPVGEPLAGHTASINTVAFSPDGQRLMTASEDHTVRLWDVATGQPLGDPLTGHTEKVNSAAFSSDGKRIASASYDGTIRLWDSDTSHLLTGHAGAIFDVAFSPDGQLLATVGDDFTLRLWDSHTGRPQGEPLVGHTERIWSVAFSPDGRTVATASDDHTVRLWHAASGYALGILAGHSKEVRKVAFSPDGRYLVTPTSRFAVQLWDAQTGQPRGRPLDHVGATGLVESVAFSPDGTRLVTTSYGNKLWLWDAETGRQLDPIVDPDASGFDGVAFSPDGTRLAALSNSPSDYTVRVYDSSTGEFIGPPLAGHTAQVNSVAFSPDGRRIVTTSFDKTIRLWDADTRQLVCDPLTGHTGAVYSAVFSPDGRRIASASQDRTVRVWPVLARPSDLSAKLTTNMSRKQWREWVSPDIPYVDVCPDLPIPDDEPDEDG